MSSRSGPRVAGTDGTDFGHRERVANHYKISVVNKGRLRFMCFLHVLLVLLMTAKIMPSIMGLLSVKPPKWLLQFKLPPAEIWEYLFMFSIQATMFGLIGMPKNNSLLVKQYIVGMLVFGFGPIGYAVYGKGFELLDYVQSGQVKHKIAGFPTVVLMYLFFCVCVQVMGFGIYFAKELLNAWSSSDLVKKRR